MKKYAFAIIALCIVITHCNGMLTPSHLSFKPYIQVLNPEIQKHRHNELYANQNTQIGEVLRDNDYFRCFQYAIQEITGFTKEAIFYGSKNIDVPLNRFFKQIAHPKPGCLVVYTDNDLNVQHFAIAVDSMNFRSKFGEDKEIFLHQLFACPSIYQNNAYFFTLLVHYENNTEQLHHDLEKSAQEVKNTVKKIVRLNHIQSLTAAMLLGISIGLISVKIIHNTK